LSRAKLLTTLLISHAYRSTWSFARPEAYRLDTSASIQHACWSSAKMLDIRSLRLDQRISLSPWHFRSH
jgi:hypothetical protein